MPTPYCRHIKTNGHRCCSLAIRGQSLCYFHRGINARMRSLNPPSEHDAMQTIIHPMNTTENRQRNPIIAEYYAGIPPNPGPLLLDLPPLEDRESIQVAISLLVSALGHNRLDPKRASAILYGLQVATGNVDKLQTEPGLNRSVLSIVLDPSGTELSPDEDPQEITEFNEWLADQDDDDEDDD